MKNTEWIKDADEKTLELAIKRGGEILKAGGLVAFPTETVYGLGGNAFDPNASKAIYAAKGRPSDNPLIVHICRPEDIKKVAVDIPDAAYAVAERFWPGPLTMILKKREELPRETTGGLDTVAVRFPDDEIARRLIDSAGGFVAAPSANTSGRPSPTVGKYVYEDLQGRIDMLLDGGASCLGLESTIIDLTQQIPVILRPGCITPEMLKEILPDIMLDPALDTSRPGAGDIPQRPEEAGNENAGAEVEKTSAGTKAADRADKRKAGTLAETDTLIDDSVIRGGLHPRAPGMKYRHYAPRGSLTIVSGNHEKARSFIESEIKKHKGSGRRTGVILWGSDTEREMPGADSVKVTGKGDFCESMARDIFRFLREFDDEGIEYMYTRALPETGVGLAVMNRLRKAAGGNVVKV